jgi:fibronectin-binding autotransporter adhesin
VVKNGAGNWTLSGTNTYTGNTTLNAGNLTVTGSLATGNLNVDGGSFFYGVNNALGTANVTVAGGNFSVLTFTDSIGNLTVNSGVANVTSGTLTATNVTLNGGTLGGTTGSFKVNTGGSFALSNGAVSAILSGTGNLSMSGAGNTVTISSASTYTGNTTITAGTLSVGTLAAGGTASGIGGANASQVNLVLNGGTLQYTGATVSTNRNMTLGTSGGTLDASGSGAVTFSNTTAFTLAGSNTARTLTFAGTNTGANTFAMPIGDNGSGSTSLDKEGAGQWVLTGANTFTGTATVNDGTLKLNATGNGAMGNVSSVVINSGGTLLLGAANQINGGAGAGQGDMTLNGGTFATGGFGQGTGTLGTLTLSTTSTVDLGAAASVVHFLDSSGASWTTGTLLYVANWTGTIGTGGGTDQLYFGSTINGITGSNGTSGGIPAGGQLSQIEFVNPNGLGGIWDATILSDGEVVAFRALPEPSTYAAGGVLTLLAGWWEWKRRRRGEPELGRLSGDERANLSEG